MVAEFESDLIRMRTREGMKIATAKGRLREKAAQAERDAGARLVKLYRAGEHTVSELEELLPVTRSEMIL
jgi:DNA invertase Pin-like site-specific DNA recombinase